MMQHFFKYFKLKELFSPTPVTDAYILSEVAKTYSRLGNTEMVKLFLENYAIAMTERDTMQYLRNGGDAPTHQTYREIKKLLKVIKEIEENVGQTDKKLIR